jgi:hypothetical protein
MDLGFDYKLFPFKEVFEYQRGSRLIEEDQVSGDIAYISSTKFNNGIDAYVNPPDDMDRHLNKMTLTNSGSVGYLFFHDYEFVASDHATVIWLKDDDVELNENIALFLKPIFEKMKYKYNFGREISNERIVTEDILLPVNEDDKPDWSFMYDYIEKRKDKVEFKKRFQGRDSNSDFDFDNWDYFNLKDIFDIENGEGPPVSWCEDNLGTTPLVTATGFNNGVALLVNHEPTHKKNTITVASNGYVGSAFFQEEPYCSTADVNVLTPNFSINKNIALFIITIIENEKFRFSYGRKWGIRRMKKSKIKLPVNEDGDLDLNLMNNYIANISYSKYI